MYERSGLCSVHVGPDEDYLRFDLEECAVGIGDMVRGASGVEPAPWTVMSAVEMLVLDPEYDRGRKYLAEYRAQTGRHWPPVFRVTLTVEAEDLSPEETDRYWVEVLERMNEEYNGGAE